MTIEPGESLEDALTRGQADGILSTDDADEVRTFASFLTAVAGIPRPADRTPEQSAAFLAAYREHYPDDYDRAIKERDTHD